MRSTISAQPAGHEQRRQEYVSAISRHFSSVCVISTKVHGKVHGITATAVSSVSADPPRLLVCINRGGRAHQAIEEAGVFCVNILRDSDEQLARVFAGQYGAAREDWFKGEDWTELRTGAPALIRACASIDCQIHEAIVQGSHTIFIGTVVACTEAARANPLIYGGRGFHQLHQTR